jgi:hypothetical protein
MTTDSWQGRTGRFAALLALLLGAPAAVAGQSAFTASPSPNPVTLSAGGATVGVTVTTTTFTDMREPITYSFSGFPSGVATGGTQTVDPPYAPVTFPFSAGSGVAAGTYTGTLTGSSASGTVTVPMTVVVERPDFVLSVVPGAVEVMAGETQMVSILATGSGGFTGTVEVVTNGPGSLSVDPGSFGVEAGGSRPVAITASPTAPAGAATITFTGTAAGVIGTRTAVVTVQVLRPPPVIETVTPSAIVAGTAENVVRLTGRHFHPAAVVASGDPGIRVLRTRVLSASAAEVVVAVRPDALPGPYRLDLRNPDGVAAAGGAQVRVHASGSLSGPLAVTAARIVLPRPWQMVPDEGPFHARALLATSGMGTVVGTWLLDGVPFERFTRVVSGSGPVEIRAQLPIPPSASGEHRLELVLEAPRTLRAEGVTFLRTAETRSGLRILAPGSEGWIDPAESVFRWSLVPGASGYQVEVRYQPAGSDGSGPPALVRRRVADPEWRPETDLRETLRASGGEIRVRAVFPGEVAGDFTPWMAFRLWNPDSGPDGPARPPGGDANPDPEPGPWDEGRIPAVAPAAQDPPPVPLRNLDLAIASATSAMSAGSPGPSAITRFQLSAQSDLRGGAIEHQLAGDFSASHDLDDPWRGRAESRSWLARFGAPGGEVSPEARIGFAPPSFLDRSELLGVFTSGGGIQGTLASVAGRVSYFQTATLAGAEGGRSDPRIGAAAYELFSADGRYLFRATTLHVTDRGVDELGPGGRGSALGFLAAADLGPRLRLLGEIGLGEYTPGDGAFDEPRDGQAFRISGEGSAGGFGYAIALGRTDAGFVNPANPGFTPAGISGQSRAEVSLSNSVGPAFVSGTYNHARDDIAREQGGNLSVSVPLSPRVSVALGGNWTGQVGDADEGLGMPGTDRTQRGIDVTISETLGRFGLTQTLSWQGVADREDPWMDQDVLNLNLGAHGALHRLAQVSATVTETRMGGVPELGTTRNRLFALQSVLTAWETGLRLTPRLAVSRARNGVQETDHRTTQYHLGARWQAPWARVPVTAEVASDWSRAWSPLHGEAPSLDRRTRFTLSLDWRADRAW